MKRQARVTKGRKISGRKVAGHNIARLKASADEAKGSRDVMADISKMYKPLKRPVTLRLDADVLAWFKKKGSGYQTRINRALRGLMMEQKKESAE
jgi:uncharacterized protein (DUF4415 family)